jgi:hypothetical protein
MSFPTMNAHVAQGVIIGKAVTTVTPLPQLATSTSLYSLFDVPAVVDVSGMEFGLTIHQDAASGGGVAMASGASTVVLRFGDGGTTGSQAASTNYLLTSGTADFGNSQAGGWVAGEMKARTGASTTDLDADDVVGLQTLANLSGAGGIGHIGWTVAYLQGKPAVIN